MLVSFEDLCQGRFLTKGSHIHPTGLLGIYFIPNERTGMFRQDFLAYSLDNKKAIHLKVYLCILIMKVFGVTSMN
jgi:hypothetical protein